MLEGEGLKTGVVIYHGSLYVDLMGDVCCLNFALVCVLLPKLLIFVKFWIFNYMYVNVKILYGYDDLSLLIALFLLDLAPNDMHV